MGPDGFQSWEKNKGGKSRDTLPLINQAMNKINSLIYACNDVQEFKNVDILSWQTNKGYSLMDVEGLLLFVYPVLVELLQGMQWLLCEQFLLLPPQGCLQRAQFCLLQPVYARLLSPVVSGEHWRN